MPKGKCQNCGAMSPAIKKQGAMRVFKVWGSAKALMTNAKAGVAVRGALAGVGGGADGGPGGLEEVEAAAAAAMDAERAKRREAAGKAKASRKRERQEAEAMEGGKRSKGDEENEEEEDSEVEDLQEEVLVGDGKKGAACVFLCTAVCMLVAA